MFRHVVLFRWTEESTPAQREAAMAALHRLAGELSDLGRVQPGADAGIVAGNFDAAVVVDFAARKDYLAYAEDPRHVDVVTTFLRPILAERAAVQHDLP